jgi:hypothetical protein
MVLELASARRAEVAAGKTVDRIIAELQNRLSIDGKTVQQEVAFMENLERNIQRLEPSQAEELHRLREIYRPEACNVATSPEPRSTATNN